MLQRLLAVALCVATSTALYADQAGEFDWSVENLGRIETVAFGGSISRGPHSVVSRGATRAVYVASDERSRALARLDVKTGEIQWRRVFVEGDSINAIHLTHYGLLSVSGSGHHIRLWELTSGVLLWDEVTLTNRAFNKTVFGGLFALDQEHSVVLTSSSVAIISLKTGRVQVQVLPKDVTKEAVEAGELAWQVKSDNTALYVLAGSQLIELALTLGRAGNDFQRLEINERAKGDVQAKTVLRRDSEEGKIAAITLTNDHLLLQNLEESKDTTAIALNSLQVANDRVLKIDTSISSSLVLVLASGKRAMVTISRAFDVEVAALVSATGSLMESATDDTVLFHSAPKDAGKVVHITSYSSKKSEPIISWETELDLASFGGDVSRAFVGCFPANKASLFTCRAMLVLKDDALIMTSNDEKMDGRNVQWVREEALANIKSVRWIIPAETEIEKQALTRIPTFKEELDLEMKYLQQLATRAMAFTLEFLDTNAHSRGADRSRAARKEPPNAHLFGFSKYILVLTASGKLFALRAEASTIAWSVFVGPEYQLFVTRDHPALGSGAELLLVSNSMELRWLDGDDGHQVDTITAGATSAPSWIVVLPKRKHLATDDEPTARRTVAVVAEDTLQVTLYPHDTAHVSHPELRNFFFYRYDHTSNVFRGYYIINDSQVPSTNYRAYESWSIVLPREQKVIATSHHHDHSVVDSAVTITGDDSLLIKYLNPNLFGLATIATERLQGGGEKNEVSVLYVSLIDSVAGRIIHRVHHPNAASPVRMVHHENRLVYSYWYLKEKRTEMVSLSLFDGAVGMHSLNPWKRPTWSSTRSSFDPKAPFVLQKSFIYPTKITSLGVTVTAHGITPQSILVGMETGQIFQLARTFIDPRQPEKPLTPEEQAEGLILYSPLVSVYNRPQAMLTYNRTVEGLHSISTSPTELESTTLVFAHGLDLFYVRMTPAKSFDLLPSDFNHEMLILLCGAFLAVTVGTKVLAQRKALQTAWK